MSENLKSALEKNICSRLYIFFKNFYLKFNPGTLKNHGVPFHLSPPPILGVKKKLRIIMKKNAVD